MTLNFEFDPEKLARIRAERGLHLPSEKDKAPRPISAMPTAAPLPRKRGRPRKIVAPVEEQEELQSDPTIGIEPAPLMRVDEKLLAFRLKGAMTGATGLGGAFVKSYLAMTEEEAEAIAEPLASYLIRRAPDSESIKEFVENYDLLAIVMGTGAYAGRVYHDRKVEVEEQRAERQRNIRSAANTASANTPEEPPFASTGQETPASDTLRDFPGPVLGSYGQP